VSAGFLGYGINRIRLLAKNYGTSKINVPQLVQHFSAFGLYLVSTAVANGYFTRYAFTRTKKSTEEYFYAVSIANLLSMISQLLMCSILWPLTVVEPPKPMIRASFRMSALDTPVVEDFTEEDEVQERIWR
jgi:hypothetical protein